MPETRMLRVCAGSLLISLAVLAQDSKVDYSEKFCFAGDPPTAERTRTLSQREREADALQLFATFAKNYGPYEWKIKRYRYDMLQLNPFWLAAVQRAPDDLAYTEVLVDWVAQLKDAHVQMLFPSGWEADLDLAVDAFDIVLNPRGEVVSYKVRVLDRGQCFAEKYDLNGALPRPFEPAPGDEVLTIDGQPVAVAVSALMRYVPGDNPRTRLRMAVDMLTRRRQRIMPSAPFPLTPTLLGNSGQRFQRTAQLRFRPVNGGPDVDTSVYWRFRGTPMTFTGIPLSLSEPGKVDAANRPNPLQRRLQAILPEGFRRTTKGDYDKPAFANALPYGGMEDVNQSNCADTSLYCGTLQLPGGRTAGYIRIPSFDPAAIPVRDLVSPFAEAVRSFSNRDAIVIDLMGNGGGSIPLADAMARTLLGGRSYKAVGFQIRATTSWVDDFDAYIASMWDEGENASLGNFRFARRILAETVALGARGRTGPLALNRDAESNIDQRDQDPSPPVLILVDELTGSAAEYFAAVFRFNELGKIAGVRSAGAGGNVSIYAAGSATEAKVSVTESIMTRIPAEGQTLAGDGMAESDVVENVGVQPDYGIDYLKTANIQSKGRLFLDELLTVVERYLQNPEISRATQRRPR
jgi:hypothetical protein